MPSTWLASRAQRWGLGVDFRGKQENQPMTHAKESPPTPQLGPLPPHPPALRACPGLGVLFHCVWCFFLFFVFFGSRD